MLDQYRILKINGKLNFISVITNICFSLSLLIRISKYYFNNIFIYLLHNRYTPKYMFSEKIYPNYLSGTGYVMSLDVASKLYHAALETPLLHLEDVYITGLCARNAKLRPINHAGFSYVPRKLDYCVLKSAITAHKVNSAVMYSIWNKLKETNVTCTTASTDKKAAKLNRRGRNIGYYLVKKHSNSRCT